MKIHLQATIIVTITQISKMLMRKKLMKINVLEEKLKDLKIRKKELLIK